MADDDDIAVVRAQLAALNETFAQATRNTEASRAFIRELQSLVNKLSSMAVSDDIALAETSFDAIMELALEHWDALSEGTTTVQFTDVIYERYTDHRGSLAVHDRRALALELLKTSWGKELVTRHRPVVYEIDTDRLKKYLLDHPKEAAALLSAQATTTDKFKIKLRPTPEEVEAGSKPTVIEKPID